MGNFQRNSIVLGYFSFYFYGDFKQSRLFPKFWPDPENPSIIFLFSRFYRIIYFDLHHSKKWKGLENIKIFGEKKKTQEFFSGKFNSRFLNIQFKTLEKMAIRDVEHSQKLLKPIYEYFADWNKRERCFTFTTKENNKNKTVTQIQLWAINEWKSFEKLKFFKNVSRIISTFQSFLFCSISRKFFW